MLERLIILIVVLSKLARTAHLVSELTGPAFAPIKRLSAGAGICISIPIIFVGFFIHPGRDPNRIRYVVAAAQIQEISKALERYKADCGDYPALSTGLHALVFNPGAKGWKGPYLRDDVPTDPWHRPYIYSRSPGLTLPEILSLGADERPAGGLLDADVSSLRVQTSVRETPIERRDRWFLLSIWIGAWTCLIACAVALKRMSRQDYPT